MPQHRQAQCRWNDRHVHDVPRTPWRIDRAGAKSANVLTADGFLGNFILSLADYAENGFFVWTEWIPVAASALAFTFLATVVLVETGVAFLRSCAGVLILQALVGLLGFALHLWFNLHGGTSGLREVFVNRAPAFAPLRFTNLALLGGLGIWAASMTRGGRSV